jgi:peptide/nickel transport system substrate-binding protein
MLAACGKNNSPSGGGGGGTSGGGDTGKGSSKTPLPKPAKFQQSPKISSSLPPVEERVGEEPYVVPHNWVTQGKYGGQIKMNITSTTADGSVGELFYSYGMLRFLNDGQVVGPGLVTKWSSNADASVWKFTLRKIKWSDGQPLTTADVIFWWEDMINYKPATGSYPETPPDEARSGKGTLCKITADDEHNFTMTFDAPAPLTADRLAMWTNGYGGNGPTWIVPSHYAKKFHPKYNKNAPKNWADEGGFWQKNMSYRLSTQVPTVLAFKLSKFSEGRQLVWERNPYAYEVTKEGDQMPYLDSILMTQVTDPQVGKVQIGNGQLDYVHGPFNGLALGDYATLKQKADKTQQDIYLWDSGSGTASIFFLSYDYFDPKYRELFREPKFRQALSMGYDRATARKAIYFEQGDPTTGTLSPKAIEYQINDTGKKTYTDWRDSYVKLDVAKANSLLDGLGLKKGSDGFRTLKDGGKLQIRIDRPADAGQEHIQKDAQLQRDWKAIGIDVRINPVPPTSFGDNWAFGKYMAHSDWEVGDGPNHLLYPQWLVPLENSRWAPLEGAMYNTKGTKDYTSQQDVDPWKRNPPRLMPEKGGPIEKLWNTYDQSKVEPDFMKRTQLVWDMIKVHIEFGPFFQGTVANPPQIIMKKKTLNNLPQRNQLFLGGFVNPWIHPTPAVYDIETLYWSDPENHAT